METEEIWKDVEGYEGYYQVSNFGRMLSWNSNHKGHKRKEPKLLSTSYKTTTRYIVMLLVKDGSFFGIKLHRLVALHFVENPNNYEFVNHIDGDRYNNRADNLEWVSPRENIAHSKLKRSGTSKILGVSFNTKKQKWIAQIRFNGKNIQVGAFKTEIEAADAMRKFQNENNIINKYSH